MNSESNQIDSANDHDTIIEMKGTLGRVASDIKELVDYVKTTHSDHEKRISVLEQWRREFGLTWKIVVGIAATVGAVIASIAQVVIASMSVHK
jgi:hypothetical protein